LHVRNDGILDHAQASEHDPMPAILLRVLAQRFPALLDDP
jgi:hypothetical protein